MRFALGFCAGICACVLTVGGIVWRVLSLDRHLDLDDI